jgi:hypothetical protein
MTRPIIGLQAIHRRYFVAEDGEELISFGTFRKLSKEMQESGAVLRFETTYRGLKKVRIVALEPFFSIWMMKKFSVTPKKDEFCSVLGDLQSLPTGK